ncbi:EF-P lysine aminoacylase GenX [Geotalea uraniireducens]|uniref:EF-P lysine aminoacylase GenX n=1 Tax=Geotalea uraniireducens TaxID=351604 RepID=A0ABM8ELN1_9BACT|nr:EF-P lysine aminoacylase EpmA [Geotalea uraniireducens]BDV43232.1 EF-P lysine aminoacylase GenX [Geotalea uraniireducens]
MLANWRLARKQPMLRARARLVQEIRQFFIAGGYLEVETPLRIPAPAPESHIEPIPSLSWFLQTSPELCMKRLLAAGYERLFQICHCWRDGERGGQHLPEFTMLEWYRAQSDYRDLMIDCEGLLVTLARAMTGATAVAFRGRIFELAPPWERLSVRAAFQRYCGMSADEALRLDLFDELMVEKIEPQLGWGTPTFIYDYPACRGALSRLKADEPDTAERFELYLGGVELANAFSELTDPLEQRRRFVAERDYRAAQGRLPLPLPEPFLAELASMPPAAGIALGIDRLVMLFCDAESIDDVVAFPPEEL